MNDSSWNPTAAGERPHEPAAAPPCELAVEVSALLDGELGAAEALRIVDHLLRCAPCASFYRRARGLDARLLEAEAGATAEVPLAAAPWAVWARLQAGASVAAMPVAGWEATAAPAATAAVVTRQESGATSSTAAMWGSSRSRRPGSRRVAPPWARRLAAALVVAAGAGLAWKLAGPTLVPRAGASDPAPQGAPMDRERFASLAGELLAADSRYRDAMCEVLEVAAGETAREGSTAEWEPRQEDLRSGGEWGREVAVTVLR